LSGIAAAFDREGQPSYFIVAPDLIRWSMTFALVVVPNQVRDDESLESDR